MFPDLKLHRIVEGVLKIVKMQNYFLDFSPILTKFGHPVSVSVGHPVSVTVGHPVSERVGYPV